MIAIVVIAMFVIINGNMKRNKQLVIWFISSLVVLLIAWLLFLAVPFCLSYTHENKEILDSLNVSFVAAGALFTAFAFAATFLSLLHQHKSLNRQINLNVFSDTIRMIMDSERFLECRAHVLSDYYKNDIENIKRLTGKDNVNFESWRKIFNEDREKALEKTDIQTIENLRKSYERTMYFCGRMDYLGVVYENIEDDPFILEYYGLTIIETYEIVQSIIDNSTINKDNIYKNLYKNYTNLYHSAKEKYNNQLNNNKNHKKMKIVTKFFMAALLAGMCNLGYAQDYWSAPKANEIVIGTITTGNEYESWWESIWYDKLLEDAKLKYNSNNVEIRNMEVGKCAYHSAYNGDNYRGPAKGVVVFVIGRESILPVVDKALVNIDKDSRMALDQVTAIEGMNCEDLKDIITDILIDKGYRILAKEYLDKLYREQQDQQSGIYNENTIVQGNNFSAVGYFINVKVSETAIRVQVVNISTGEYEGNATVNY